MHKMNACQRAVWRYLWERFQEGQGSPTQREIAKAVNYSRPYVCVTLRALEVRGCIDLHWLRDDRLAARAVLRVHPFEGEPGTVAADGQVRFMSSGLPISWVENENPRHRR